MREVVNLLDVLAAKENEIASRLEDLRRTHGLSQEAAAHKVGVSYRQWQRWESGNAEPRGTNLLKISEGFGLPVADIVQDNEPQASQLDRIEQRLTTIEDQLRLLRLELATDALEATTRPEAAPAERPAAQRRRRA